PATRGSGGYRVRFSTPRLSHAKTLGYVVRQGIKIGCDPDSSFQRARRSGTGGPTVRDQSCDGLACFRKDDLMTLLHFFDQRRKLGLSLRNIPHYHSNVLLTRPCLVWYESR